MIETQLKLITNICRADGGAQVQSLLVDHLLQLPADARFSEARDVLTIVSEFMRLLVREAEGAGIDFQSVVDSLKETARLREVEKQRFDDITEHLRD